MADIIFKYSDMATTVNELKGYALEYKNAASVFLNTITEAMSPWEGASKNKFANLLNGDVKEHIEVTVPQVVEALAEMLKANADQMKATDDAIAESIPSNLS